MKFNAKIFFVSFFSIMLFKYTYSVVYSSKDALSCFQKNTFDNIQNASKKIGSPSVCHSVSTQCCFINITHYYGSYLLTQEYCNYLNVNITEFQQFLQDLYEDDEKFYANYTAHNINNYVTIGRNLDYNLVDRLDCFLGPHTNTEYSTYVTKNCQEFKDDVCTGVKNNTRMNHFVHNFHQKYSDAYCNKNEGNNMQECVRYTGTRSNDKMLMPLLEELRDYLQADNDEYVVYNNETNVDIEPEIDSDDDQEFNYMTNWTYNRQFIKNCTDRPEVKVQVICPEGYETQNYIQYNFVFLIFLLFIF